MKIEAPEDAFIEQVMAHAHEIALDVKLDGNSRNGVISSHATDMGSKTLLGIESAFVNTT